MESPLTGKCNFKSKPTQFLYLLLIWIILLTNPLPSSSQDYTKLIYKGCADQQFQDSSVHWKENLKSLYNTLTIQSTKSNFSNATAGEESQSQQIFGLYQCRGDLSGVDCYNCVSQFPKHYHKLCGEAIAVRVQLLGCYMKYEVVGFKQVSVTELLYKYCDRVSSSSSNLVGQNVSSGNNGGFDEKRETAFRAVENGVVGNGGFYKSGSNGVTVVGQCEGDLIGTDCQDCVKTALKRVESECGDAISGQVYLNRCYVSYSLYANGIEEAAVDVSSSGRRQKTEKIVAVVVGVTAGVGFLFVVLLFAKSLLRKKKVSKPHGEGYITHGHGYMYS